MPDPRNAHAKQWIKDVQDSDNKYVSAWEWQFVDSVDNQVRAGRELSEKQLDILERIYTKI